VSGPGKLEPRWPESGTASWYEIIANRIEYQPHEQLTYNERMRILSTLYPS
jgi:hypothetical protein